MRWSAFVLAHISGIAVVQVDGGLLTVRDSQGRLQDSARAFVEVNAMGDPPPPGEYLSAGCFNVERQGQVALLCRANTEPSNRFDGPTPLVLKAGVQLPASVHIRVAVDPAELHEGVNVPGAAPLPNPECRPCRRHPLHLDPDDIVKAMQGGHCK